MMDLLLFLLPTNIDDLFCQVKSFIISAPSLLIICFHSTNLSYTSRHPFHFEASLCISQSINSVWVGLKTESICWELIFSSSEDKDTTWKLFSAMTQKWRFQHNWTTQKVSIFPPWSWEKKHDCVTLVNNLLYQDQNLIGLQLLCQSEGFPITFLKNIHLENGQARTGEKVTLPGFILHADAISGQTTAPKPSTVNTRWSSAHILLVDARIFLQLLHVDQD